MSSSAVEFLTVNCACCVHCAMLPNFGSQPHNFFSQEYRGVQSLGMAQRTFDLMFRTGGELQMQIGFAQSISLEQRIQY